MPFNPFAGQPADTHRGRPPKKRSEPEPPAAPAEPAETQEASWEATWGKTATTEPAPEPPTSMPADRTPEQDAPDGFAAAFAGQRPEEPAPADQTPERDEPAAPDGFAAAFAGQRPEEPASIDRTPERGEPEPPEPDGPDDAAPDVPPEFAAAFAPPEPSPDPSNEPEDLAERARLERIGMETADPDDADDGFGDWRSMIGSMSDDGPADRSGGWKPDDNGENEPEPDGPEQTEPEPDGRNAWTAPADTSGGWGASTDENPSTDGWGVEGDGWPEESDDDEEDEPEPSGRGGGILKPVAVIAACVLVLGLLGGGSFLLVRNIASGRARSAHSASCATYSRWVGEYYRVASDAKRLSIKAGAVDRQCPASDADKAAGRVRAKSKTLSAKVAKAAAREWGRDKKALAGLSATYPSASADTLSDARSLAGESDPTDLARLNDMRARAKRLTDRAKKEQSDADAKARAAKEKADAEAKAKQEVEDKARQEAEQEAARQQAEAEEAARQQAAQQQQQRTYTPQRQTYTPRRQTTTPTPTPAPAQPSAPSGNASQDF